MDESKIEDIKKNLGLYGIWTLDLSDTGAVQIYDFHIFTVVYSPLHGFIWYQHNEQLPVGLLAQFVEHCTVMGLLILSFSDIW